MKLISFLLILLILFWGCKKGNKESVINTVDSLRVVDSIHKLDSLKYVTLEEKLKNDSLLNSTSNEYETTFFDYIENLKGIPVLKINIFEKRNIIISNPNKINNILLALFPGKLYTKNSFGDKTARVVWKSPLQQKIKLKGFIDGDSYLFPSSYPWETEFTDSFRFEIGESKYYAFFFSSGYFDGTTDFLRTGRTNCATLGVAFFKQDTLGWILEGFNPSIGCFGMFGNPHLPHKLKLNDSAYGFFITNGLSFPGGPYYSDVHFFKLDEKITKLFTANNIERLNSSISLWTSKISSYANNNCPYYNIEIKTNGFLNYYGLDSLELTGFDYNYDALIKKGGNYRFWQRKTYTADSAGKYKLKKEKFNYKTWPIDTIKGNVLHHASWFFDKLR